MSLAALVNGIRIVGPLLTDLEWDGLHANKIDIKMLCCGESGFSRTSKFGTKHFVHRAGLRNGCQSKPESLLHMKLKSDVAQACMRAGYEADVEVVGTDWRADVFATKGKLKIAFEIQLSPLAHSEMVTRQEKYDRDGVRGCWFYQQHSKRNEFLPSNRQTTGKLQSFLISEQGDSVLIAGQEVSVAAAVGMLLSREVKFCEVTTTVEETDVLFLRTECYKCNQPSDFYSVVPRSRCGVFHGNEDPIAAAASRDVIRQVTKFLATPNGSLLRVAFPEMCYPRSSDRESLSFRCYWCGAIFSPEFIYRVLPEPVGSGMDYDGAIAEIVATSEIKLPMRSHPDPHWCFSKRRQFCT